MMSALEKFSQAIQAEKSVDARLIVGARIPHELLKQMIEEARSTVQQGIPTGSPEYPRGVPEVPHIFGIPVYLSLDDEIKFDHCAA